MARLIDADVLKKKFRTSEGARALRHSVANLFAIDSIVDAQPTVDAVEVKHGHWEQCDVYDRCSACCRHTIIFPLPGLPHFKYCPYCGAKMDGDFE